jgi:uncharacterized protein YndB with AHSA1/START domain
MSSIAVRAEGRSERVNESAGKGASTRVARIIKAPRKAVYQAFVDRDAVATWLPPENMRGQVHAFEPREGGIFHMSLTYKNPEDAHRGKTSADTDTVKGKFVELVPFERIVEVFEFESDEPRFAGEMRVTALFADADGGTEITMICEDIPEGISPADNEMGSRSSLQNLADLLQSRGSN